MSEDRADVAAAAWAGQYGSATTLRTTPAGPARVLVATPPAGSPLADRAPTAVLTDGEVVPWPELPVDVVRTGLAAEDDAPSGRDARVATLLREAGWTPGRRLDDEDLGPWLQEVDRLAGQVPGARAHETAEREVRSLGSLVLTLRGWDPVHLVPVAHAFDPAGCRLAADVLGEPVAPVAVQADAWPTELYQGASGRVVAVQLEQAHLVGADLDAALCTLAGCGRWVPVEVP